MNKNIFNQKVLIQKQQTEFTKLQNTNKQLSQAIADMRDELLERPVDIEAERAKFAKNLETGLTIEKLTPEQKKEYDLYDSTLKWLKKNGIKFYFFEAPYFAKIKNLDEFYKVKRSASDFVNRKDEKQKVLFNKVFGQCNYCSNFIIKNLYKWKSYNNGKYIKLCDSDDPELKISNGARYTDFPKNITSNLTVYFLGPCIVLSSMSGDKHTIESFFSKNSKRKSINYGAVGKSDNAFLYIRDLTIKNDDLVVIINIYPNLLKLALKNNNTPYFELSHLFYGPNNYGYCFRDEGRHCNCTANRVIAKYIYKILKPEIEKYDETKPRKYVRMDDINDPAEKAEYLKQNPDFKKYLDSLIEIKKKQDIKGNVGSIVMNCNPFTLGHRYLIETAAKQVDKLVIFVVEEDKSVYPFKDRMELVKKGVSDLKNVIVLPSGNFIISLATFPEYFVKGQKQKDKIDPSKDVSLFAKYIAPAMGIKVRFVGEEPYDTVTKQYNHTMRDFFPTFGLKFVEIKRKATDGKDDFISASKARKLLEENKWEELKKYVPQTTYDYLKNLKK
ncbi:MAG: adenylyltransferase/cytidyltransferase family protein [Alphaproteobacteria bacterium]|nr:adenylyltransferase/cytidyltransferase family protein [Alphaproteobacteria bacterium]